MRVIDHNSAMRSLNDALVPGATLVDGRTEQDRLSFLANFASLINFYDQNNNINGNWTPFLLKDPVILLASISKTNYEKHHSLYLHTILNLERAFKENPGSEKGSFLMNQLFNQITGIFILIERWTYYMHTYADDYDLKNYTIQQVKTKFSNYFWAIISLRQYLVSSSAIEGIEPVPFLFGSFDEAIWKENRNKLRYWEVLELDYPLTNYKPVDFFGALKRVGDELFNFFHTIIRHSPAEFEKQKTKKTKYPDTVLLRSFVNLLKNHQDQLNAITQKHLDFYYRTILKQSELPAVPDHVFVCVELTKRDAVFQLPAGSLFDAGVDADKNSIVFKSLSDENLNPAAVTGAYTLSAITTGDNFLALELQNITEPGVLKKDSDGKILTWESFNASANKQPVLTKLGIAFASPLLLLREGKRKITVELNFQNDVDLKLLQKADYYLSTKKDWLKVSAHFPPPAASQSVVKFEIDLEIIDPSIESFLKNPDGADSVWPMLKIQFNSVADLADPPVLNSITIEVAVSNIQTFQLYNDFGALSAKTPFAPFGTVPVKNSNFVIGNNEIFSKPLNSFFIELNWNNLPKDFFTYYKQYNNYLFANGIIKPVRRPSLFEIIWRFLKRVFKVIVYVVKCLINWLDCALTRAINEYKKRTEWKPVAVKSLFSNLSFTVDFELLQSHLWKQYDMSKQQKVHDPAEETVSFVPYEIDPWCRFKVADPSTLLFSTDGSHCTLGNSDCFGYIASGMPILFADPQIQQSPLKFTDASESGFMKISLTGPGYGFGSELYPNVVSYIALNNSQLIMDKKDPKDFIPPANLPFVPKLTNITGYYTASQQYIFNSDAETYTYPLQCFLYSPFVNSLVYDNSVGTSSTLKNSLSAISGKKASAGGMLLHPSFNYNGVLFLEIQDLVPANALNIYFELARSYGVNTTAKAIEYYYLGAEGWKELPVLADGAKQLTCSGIIKVSVPGDITDSSVAMPGNKYWFSINVKNESSSFGHMIFLKTNGIELQRSGKNYLQSTTVPRLLSNAITRLAAPVPQITTVMQPFVSFGGKMAENSAAANLRVSNRLKTKDRVISTEDCSRLLQQEFGDIYYSKAVFNSSTKATEVYVVKAYGNSKDTGAFVPLISECKEEKMQDFLRRRSSVFASITVSNFDMEYVRITATILLNRGFESQFVRKKVNDALNIFLSPWIKETASQVVIDQEVDDAQVTSVIKNIEGVSSVQDVLLQTWMSPGINSKNEIPLYEKKIRQSSNKALFISSMDHIINCKY